MTKRLELVGQRFDRLVVVADGGTKNGGSMWECVCDCGNTKIVSRAHLRNGDTKSCGCFNKDRISMVNASHGHTKNRETSKAYRCWQNMKNRCYNIKVGSYKYYGSRGIKVCPRWLESFENFYADVGDIPKGMTLDRKDNNGDYEPGNWKLSTIKEQCYNRRSNHLITHEDKTMTLTEWMLQSSISKGTIRARIYKQGWSDEEALFTPIMKQWSRRGGK